MQRRTISARSWPETSPVETAPNRCPIAGRGLTGSPPSPAKVYPLFLPITPVDRAALWLPAVFTAHRAIVRTTSHGKFAMNSLD
jgi:hypothetical protein